MFDRILTMQNDEAMREFEGDIIKNTLDRISDEMAIDLLSKLTEKFRVSPRQSISILRWLLPFTALWHRSTKFANFAAVFERDKYPWHTLDTYQL